MVGITIIRDSNSSVIPHLSTKKSSKKPKEMNTTTIIIIFGLIGIIFGLMFLGYWKTSSEVDSIKKWIKMQDNLPTTTTRTSTNTTPATTTTSTTTTFEREEFEPKSCDGYNGILLCNL